MSVQITKYPVYEEQRYDGSYQYESKEYKFVLYDVRGDELEIEWLDKQPEDPFAEGEIIKHYNTHI